MGTRIFERLELMSLLLSPDAPKSRAQQGGFHVLEVSGLYLFL